MATGKNREQIRKDNPNVWVAVKDGDVISGKVADVTAAWSDVRDGFYPIIIIATDEAPTGYDRNGEYKVHAMATVLNREFSEKRPNVGERVTITYKGTSNREPKPGQSPAEVYDVRCPDRPDQAQNVYAKIYGATDTPNPNNPVDNDLPF